MENHISLPVDKDEEEFDVSGEEQPLVQSIECRICQDEDIIKNLEVPCACRGSLKFAHRKCVQRWCNEKKDIICEICRQPYKPGYTAPTPQSNDTVINISENLAFNDSVTPAAEADYEDNNANGASFYRPAAFILIVLLILRHALIIGDDDYNADDDPTICFALFLLRAAGFLLPCYIMVWLISMVQRCRESQEDETLEATNVPFMNHEEQQRGLHVTIEPGPMTPPTYTPPANPTHDTLH